MINTRREQKAKRNRKKEIDGAAGRNRTGTGITSRGILSPLRLPVPPPRQC